MRAVDAGVRDVVALLNKIPGVQTRASCEGKSCTRSARHHADLAYVLLQYPLPLALQDFLLERLDPVARIEHDGVYCRWPPHNREFLSRLADAARAYQLAGSYAPQPLRVPLALLRARVARRLVEGASAHIGLCMTCREIGVDLHAATHATVPLLQIPCDQALQWFAAFVTRPGNGLDTQLIEREGWEHVVARTHRGDFGSTFYRRWLQYRSRRLADLTTQQLRLGVEAARRRGSRTDFYFDDAHAYFVWEPTQGKGPGGLGMLS